MRNAGYLVNTRHGTEGDPGLFYDYILAGNGLFLRAQNHLLRVNLCIAEARVRGLQPLRQTVELPKGKIPYRLYELAIASLFADPFYEHYLAITWKDRYQLQIPPQEGQAGSVRYQRLPGTVLEFHSHGMMPAFFSSTDDQDEQGLGIYAVVGSLNMLAPLVKMRVGAYGYFAPIEMEELFDV